MNVSSYTNWNLIRYATVLSFLILSNYFLWSINSWQVIKFINFFLLISTFTLFFISKEFNNFWYLRIIILLLILICLGTPTIPIDSWFIYLFSAKVMFYESNLYTHFLDNNYLNISARPKLPATLSATFAQLIGTWNEVFPKSSNVIIIFPPIIFLISFFKDKIIVLLWLFLMLLFSGKLFINGLMDGIIGLYFVASILISYNITISKSKSDKKLLYIVLFLFFTILSLCKDEGAVMVLVVLLSTIFTNLAYKCKIDFKLFVTTLLSLLPIIFWKYTLATTNIKFGAWAQSGDSSNRILRITNQEDLLNIISFIIRNEKLVISLILFIFFAIKYFNKNRRLIFLVTLNFILYFPIIIFAILIAPHDIILTLQASSVRLFIPLVLMLSYFSIFLIQNNIFLSKKSIKLR